MRRLAPLCALAAAISFLALPAPGHNSANAQQAVAVSGRVVNGTEGAVGTAGMRVLLHVLNPGSDPVASSQAITDDDGSFRFADVPSSPGQGHILSVSYDGVVYSNFIDVGKSLEGVELKIYEATSDVTVVNVEQHFLVVSNVDVKEQRISVVELVSLANRSDRTLVPDLSTASSGQFSFLRFSLPPGASGLNVSSDMPQGDIVSVGTGFAINSPVLPGQHNLRFSYRFPYRSGAFSYSPRLLQGAELYQVLVPARFAEARVASLQQVPDLNISGSGYHVWESRNLAQGQELTLEMTHLPEPGLLDHLQRWLSDRTVWQVTIPSVLGASLLGLLLYSMSRASRQAAAPISAGAGSTGSIESQRQELIQAVAVLDENFHRGLMSEAEYQTRRSELKGRIIQASGRPEEGEEHVLATSKSETL